MKGFGSVGLQEARRGGKCPNPKSKTHPLARTKYPTELPAALHEVCQTDAKKYLPPGAFIWRLNVRGGWGVTVGRHHDHVEPWARHRNDSSAAMWAAIRFAWRLYLEDECLPLDHCPFKGLL